MNSFLFNERATQYNIAILSKELNQSEIEKYYVNPLGLNEPIIYWKVEYGGRKKPQAATMAEWCDDTLPKLKSLKVKYLLITDASYFSHITKKVKPTSYFGYALPIIKYKGYEDILCILLPSYSNLFYNPKLRGKINDGLNTLKNCINGTYQTPGSIIKNAYYPETVNEIETALADLLKYDKLTCDIETRSLAIDKAGIETISFSWNDNSGIAFCVDKERDEPYKIRDLLFSFFCTYTGKLMYHNGGFDIKILLYELWMDDIDDIEMMLEGLEILTRNIHDTQFIYYLATNTAAGNKLSLKDISQAYTGSYAQSDIKDTTLISVPELLEYNLKDCLATFWAFDKYYDVMVQEEQLPLYEELFLPSLKVLIQTELDGMPLSMANVRSAKESLNMLVSTHRKHLSESRVIKNFNFWLQHYKRKEANAKLKVKVHPYSHFKDTQFNEGSSKQIAYLMHSFLGYPVTDTTDTGLPATGNKELIKLSTIVDDETKEIINHITEINSAIKILSTFISAFEEKSILHKDGLHYLHGNFNVTGTKSHRLSSSNPNLQNLPSGSKYGKLVKKCFISPPHKILCGADFNALEARIGALLTQDPQKLKIYINGYDSHSNNAFHYWPDKFPDIVDTPESVNAIEDDYPELRQKSKTVTFAAQYGGTYHTFMNSGFSEKEAKLIEANYHKMHKVSDEWVKTRIKKACTIGYVPLAFGGRLRTPVLSQVVYGSHMPYKAKEEERSAGNAMQQSYGLLNSRALIELMDRVWKSKYRLSIRPIALVHDSCYFIIDNTYGCLEWLNINLIECMNWTGLPEIQHPVVGLPAELIIHYPTWADQIKLPNKASKQEILSLCQKK